jgi:hypothetical protein
MDTAGQEQKKSLIIWVPNYNGFETPKFEDVSGFNNWGESIQFLYAGQSTHEWRSARFYRNRMIGFALTATSEDSHD